MKQDIKPIFVPREAILEKVIYDEEDPINGQMELRTDIGCFAGLSRKDLFRRKDNDDWNKYLIKGVNLVYWNIQYSRVIAIQVLINNEWETMWIVGNDFDTYEKEEKDNEEYNNMANKEAKKVKELIDKGKSYKEIDKAMDYGHSGFSYGWCMNKGISMAKNRINAEKVRKDYNISCGGTGEEKGTINPAILTISAKK